MTVRAAGSLPLRFVGVAFVALFRAALQLDWILPSGGTLGSMVHGTRWMVEPVVHGLAWDFRLGLPFRHQAAAPA